jgi:hypothetical protein
MALRSAILVPAVAAVLIAPVPSPAQTADEPAPKITAQATPQAPAQTQTSSAAENASQEAKASVSISGMIAGAAIARLDTTVEPFFSLRAIPELKFTLPAGRGWTLDGEASANAYGSLVLHNDGPAATSGAIKPYRAWLRLASSRFEARAGLQKISFGSATLFRPLMWFDGLDPRDPLQLTDGVYALLLRYYTPGNANVWAWGLLANDDRRGFDLAPPDDRTPEFGGRAQVPLFKGEIAATYHHRKADIAGLVPIMDPFAPLPIPPVPEDRFGLDGKWDVGVGLSFEAALVHQRTPFLFTPYQRAYTVGLDYTFGLGHGLTAVGEHFRIDSSARAFSSGDGFSFTGLLLRYPLGLRDEISGIFYYDWEHRDAYRFLSWKHTTDALTLNAIVYWNPAELLVFQGQPGSGTLAGTGLELVLAYYF